MCNPFEEVQKTVDRAWTGTRDAVANTLNGVGKIVENVIKNPLPVVTMVAATWALGPSGLALTSSTATAAALAAGSIAAYNGKNVGDIAKSALLAYGGSEFAKYTGAGDFTASIGNSIGGTTGSAVASGLNNAFFNSSVAALGGKNVGEAFGAGFLGGAAGSLAGSAMNSQTGQSYFGAIKESFGLNDSQMKYIQGGATAMGTAAISGQDPQVALTNYVAQNLAKVGKEELGKQFTSAKNYLVDSYDAWKTAKEDQQSIIDRRNALYEEAKPIADQYTALKAQYDDVVSKLKADSDYVQQNRGGYDAAMAAYESNKSNETIDRVNAEAEKLKPYTDSFDRNKTTYDQLEIQLKDLNPKLTDYSLRLNGFDSDIQASNDKITQLSDTFADKSAEFEKTSKQVGTYLVDTATSDIQLAEITRQEEAAKEAERLEAERQNTLRIEEERLSQKEQQPPPVEVPGEGGGTLTVNPKTGAVDVREPATSSQPPGAVYNIDDTDIGANIGSETVTTSPGEEPLADLSKSGVMMPDGSYKTWAELDALAGVPSGTIYTDGGTTITQEELQSILDGTYTNPKQAPTPGAGVPKPPAPTPAPKPAPAPTTPAPVTPAPAAPTQQNNSANMLALLSLLQPQQQPQIQQPVEGAKVELMENIFGTDFTTPRPEGTKKYSSGGEIEALLHLLRS
jgi:hypothetical protein